MLRKADKTISSRYPMEQRRNAIKCSKAGIPERYWNTNDVPDDLYFQAFEVFTSNRWLVILFDGGKRDLSNRLVIELIKRYRIPCYYDFLEVVKDVSEFGRSFTERWLKIDYTAFGFANVSQSKYMKGVSADLVNMISSVYSAKTKVAGVIAIQQYKDMKSVYGSFIEYLTSEPIFEFMKL